MRLTTLFWALLLSPSISFAQVSVDGSYLDAKSPPGTRLTTTDGSWTIANPDGSTPALYHIFLNGVDSGGIGSYVMVANHGRPWALGTDKQWYQYSPQSHWSLNTDGPRTDTTVTCTPPKSNTDGSPAVPPFKFKFYHGLSNGIYPDSSSLQDQCSYIWPLQAVGAHYFVVTVADAGGDISSYSNEAAKGVVWVLPQAPNDLRIIDGPPSTVYAIKTSKNQVSTTNAVGTIPPGTMCDPKQRVGDMFVVPREAVTWFGNVRPQVVVATCQAPGP